MSNVLDDDPRDDLKIKAQDGDVTSESADDTEGHSMQMLDLARTVSRDRERETQQANKSSRMRNADAAPKSGIRRFFRRGG
jgi:hypothetical protein